jgi:hypothetical protein|tara:strand:+ start:3348 stop:4103 length:756 start_codon:yes stop_codon:yes gene_type:complete
MVLLILGCSPKQSEWNNLLVNNSLEGWHIFQDDGSKKGWRVENNILIFDTISALESGLDDASLLSNKKYTSFEIKFDWKIEKGGNSGFMWGVSEAPEYKFPYQTGPEIQIIDIAIYDTPKDVLGGEIELNNILTDLNAKKHYLGAVYDMYSPKEINSYNTAGEWNTYHIKIDHKNNEGWVKLNEKLINKFKLRGPEWDTLLQKSKFSKSEGYEYLGDKRWYDFATYPEGYISFQDHPGKAYFKNISVKELN